MMRCLLFRVSSGWRVGGWMPGLRSWRRRSRDAQIVLSASRGSRRVRGESSAEKLIQKLTGATASEARALTAAGKALDAVQGGGSV